MDRNKVASNSLFRYHRVQVRPRVGRAGNAVASLLNRPKVILVLGLSQT